MKAVELLPNKKIECHSPAQIEPHISNFKRKEYTSFVTINNEKNILQPKQH